jgi:CDP-diacylglycerol--serine O-phosphatidyltransferase
LKIKQHIPNFLTCCNLLCGCLAIVCAFQGNLIWAAYLVGIAAVFDFFDGFAARLLRVVSPIGKDLDSLADMVTFGVVPGIIMFQLMNLAQLSIEQRNIISGLPLEKSWPSFDNHFLLSYVSFVIPVFSAIRLAKFNNDVRQTTSFIGLPTPANAVLIAAIPLILFIQFSGGLSWAWEYLLNIYFLLALSVILSFLLISELPLFALKFKTFSWNGNKTRYIFMAFSLLLVICFQFLGIPLIIILYIILSLLTNPFQRHKNLSSEEREA